MMLIYEHKPVSGRLGDTEGPWVVHIYRKDSEGKKIFVGLFEKDGKTEFTQDEARRYGLSAEARRERPDG